MKKCPREGLRVRFEVNPAARMLYTRGTAPPPGTEGTIVTLPVPGGRRTCMPGPGGGLVYAAWDNWGTTGVFRAHAIRVDTGKSLAGARRRRRK